MALNKANENIHFLRSRRDAFRKICEYYSKEITNDTPITILEFFERELKKQFMDYKVILNNIDKIGSETEDKTDQNIINNIYSNVMTKIEDHKSRLAKK